MEDGGPELKTAATGVDPMKKYVRLQTCGRLSTTNGGREVLELVDGFDFSIFQYNWWNEVLSREVGCALLCSEKAAISS